MNMVLIFTGYGSDATNSEQLHMGMNKAPYSRLERNLKIVDIILHAISIAIYLILILRKGIV